mmetsp:Transcript_7551/g.14044  ORF Transcript_7551/g.14044 Transcript_7551/m.14044 type:complete len:255 (+) Transcript_7551:1415-2179(+)
MDSIGEKLPSFYELVAQDLFSSTLANSIKFVLELLCNRSPRLIPLRYYVPELSGLLLSALDLLSLNYNSATLTENFYGLNRLAGSHRAYLAFTFLKHVMPIVHLRLLNSKWLGSIYNAVKAAFMTHYAYFQGSYYSPAYFLTSQVLVRQTQVKPFNWYFFGILMVLKALEVWASSSQASVSDSKMITPPYTNTQVRSGLCGICRKPHVNATALIESGYVFCFSCISDQVQRHGCCPLSGFQATAGSLRVLHNSS